MGYDLHITRARHWAENQDDRIEAREWLGLVETDEELTLDVRNGPYFARRSGPNGTEEPWLDWFEGNIHATYPDPLLLGKMLQIADKLGAKVQGDDGETYESVEDHPGPLPSGGTKLHNSQRIPAYQRREIWWNLVTYGTIAIVILAAIVLDLW